MQIFKRCCLALHRWCPRQNHAYPVKSSSFWRGARPGFGDISCGDLLSILEFAMLLEVADGKDSAH